MIFDFGFLIALGMAARFGSSALEPRDEGAPPLERSEWTTFAAKQLGFLSGRAGFLTGGPGCQRVPRFASSGSVPSATLLRAAAQRFSEDSSARWMVESGSRRERGASCSGIAP